MRLLITMCLALLGWFGSAGAGPAPTLLVVTPTTECVFSGTEGGPFTPTGCSYTLTASRAQANFAVTGRPAWLTSTVASSRTPVTLTYTLAANALPPGNYQATISFSNLSAPQDPVTRTIRLTVVAKVVPPPPPPPPPLVASWTITATVAPAHYTVVGDTLTWQYVLSNTGQVPITGIQVTSDKGTVTCPFTTLELPAKQMLCSHAAALTEADIVTSSITSTVTARSSEAPTITGAASANYVPTSGLSFLFEGSKSGLAR